MYGPKGVGALYVRRKNPRVQLSPLIDGGGQGRGMRSGTLNVPGIAGLGKACASCSEEMPQKSCRMAGLRNRLRDKIMSSLDEVYINGSIEHRLPNNLNISFAYVEGESLLMGINDVAGWGLFDGDTRSMEDGYSHSYIGEGLAESAPSLHVGLRRVRNAGEGG